MELENTQMIIFMCTTRNINDYQFLTYREMTKYWRSSRSSWAYAAVLDQNIVLHSFFVCVLRRTFKSFERLLKFHWKSGRFISKVTNAIRCSSVLPFQSTVSHLFVWFWRVFESFDLFCITSKNSTFLMESKRSFNFPFTEKEHLRSHHFSRLQCCNKAFLFIMTFLVIPVFCNFIDNLDSGIKTSYFQST